MNLNKDTYIITITCDYEGSTPILMQLSPLELASLRFIADLSEKLSSCGSQPYMQLTKFPYDKYKKRKLSSDEQKEYKEIVQANRKAYNKIKNEIKKKLKKAPINTSIKVE